MQVAKWGNSLAVRLPATVVKALNLKEGDQVEITVAGDREFRVQRDRRREEARELFKNLSRPGSRRASNLIAKKRMRGDCFYDTCILVYALARKRSPRRCRASFARGGRPHQRSGLKRIRIGGEAQISTLFSSEIAALSSASIDLCGVPLPLTLQTHDAAMKIAWRYGFQFYDCVIVASALEAGCRTLYTEDLQHYQEIDTLLIVNPFLSAQNI